MSLLIHGLPVIAFSYYDLNQPHSDESIEKPVSIYILAEPPPKNEPVEEKIIKELIPPTPEPEPVLLASEIPTTKVDEISPEPSVEQQSAKPKTEKSKVIKLLYLLHSVISKKQQYPKIARHRSFQGSTIVEFKLHPDGKIIQRRLHQTSGHKILDIAALNAVKAIDPFRIAGNYITQPQRFRVKIIFSLEKKL